MAVGELDHVRRPVLNLGRPDFNILCRGQLQSLLTGISDLGVEEEKAGSVFLARSKMQYLDGNGDGGLTDDYSN